MLSCQHLEISEFGTYSVDMGGKAQVMTLQKCAQCGKYLSLDGTEISTERILGRGGTTKPNMRTITIQLNDDVYEKLESVIAKESGNNTYQSKIMSEIVALGLRDYDRSVKHH
ncbi:MAG TPA: hypothetical protein VNE86_01890 [Nitrososphaerales archaeon]|nr:hypothetical protein [Nitrososphaerales archaeon]